MGKDLINPPTPATGDSASETLVELKIQIPPDLYVAYQRCSWAIIHETGRQPLAVMEEMVRDFLIKHGC
ncbi:MAG: hypothetical protein J0652_12760 [Desulfobulbaceae bacterium]|jgi:hypothetical protein|nr:hypothetical protein [Desulfobulbaceae bacterium]